MKKYLVRVYEKLVATILAPLLSAEQRKPPFPQINERAAEYAFAFRALQRFCKGPVLDVGSGRSSFPHLMSVCGFRVTAIDRMDDYWTSFVNRHFRVLHNDILQPSLDRTFQIITCLSVLEHIPNHKEAVSSMCRLLEPGGFLILSFPYNENIYHEDVYRHPEAGYGSDAGFITQIYSRSEINEWLSANHLVLVEQEYFKVFEGPLWTMGKRVIPVEQTTVDSHHHHTCLLFKKKG